MITNRSPTNHDTVTTSEFIPRLQSLQANIQQLIAELEGSTQVHPDGGITQEEVDRLHRELIELDYKPSPEQMARVLTGSRSIADARLRGLAAYARYRGKLSRREVKERLSELRLPEAEAAGKRPADDEGWKGVDFFDTGAFDKLSDDKAEELKGEVNVLGFRKATERLPEYMRKARKRLPRAFEPWTREERALLVEAMCYTNDGERLAAIFGRSEAAVKREGKRLIWKSRAEARLRAAG